jgi:hypothetical protein
MSQLLARRPLLTAPTAIELVAAMGIQIRSLEGGVDHPSTASVEFHKSLDIGSQWLGYIHEGNSTTDRCLDRHPTIEDAIVEYISIDCPELLQRGLSVLEGGCF